MNGFRLFVEDQRVRVVNGPNVYSQFQIQAGNSTVSLDVRYGRGADNVSVTYSLYFDTKSPGIEPSLKSEFLNTVIDLCKKRISFLSRHAERSAKKMHIIVGLTLTMAYDWPDKGQELIATLERHMEEFGHIGYPDMLYMGKTRDEALVKYYGFMAPPDFSMDWRPDSATPEDFYAA